MHLGEGHPGACREEEDWNEHKAGNGCVKEEALDGLKVLKPCEKRGELLSQSSAAESMVSGRKNVAEGAR